MNEGLQGYPNNIQNFVVLHQIDKRQKPKLIPIKPDFTQLTFLKALWAHFFPLLIFHSFVFILQTLNKSKLEVMIKVEEESPSYRLPKCIQPPVLPDIDSEEYIPSRARRSIKRQLIRKKQKSQNYNLSLWKLQENMAYMDFLISNYSLFTKSHNDRRLMKINVLMSQAIKTRSPDQCRSHHQKMIKYHRDIPSIIEYIKGLRISDTNSNTTDDNLVKIETHEENSDS